MMKFVIAHKNKLHRASVWREIKMFDNKQPFLCLHFEYISSYHLLSKQNMISQYCYFTSNMTGVTKVEQHLSVFIWIWQKYMFQDVME